MSFGRTLKAIRTARLVDQQQLSQEILSRTSISQIENNKQSPSYDKALLLMEKLGISLNGFEYIDNNYKRNQFEEIIYQFEHIVDSNETEQLKKLLSSAKNYEEKHPNQVIKNIICVVSAFIKMNTVDEPQKLKYLVAPIWKNLEKVDTWTTLDIFLINDILYYFDQKTAKSIAQITLSTISKKFPHLLNLKNAILINSGYLASQSGDVIFAKRCFDQSIILSRKLHRFDLLWLSKARLARLQKNPDIVKHCKDILYSMGASEMIKAIDQESKLSYPTPFLQNNT